MPIHSPDKRSPLAVVKAEPALVSSLVVAVLNLGTAFGLHLSGDQTAAINAVVGILLALIYVRPRVSPTVNAE